MSSTRNAPHITGIHTPGARVSQAEARISDSLPQNEPSVGRPARLWLPKRVLFTRSAAGEAFGEQVMQRLERLGVPYDVLKADRLPSLGKGDDVRAVYRAAKDTLALVNAPPSSAKLQPIPPSSDWQFHLAKGCPAHCQYCYLAGSLSGPPITRAYANLPTVLDNLRPYIQQGAPDRRPNRLGTVSLPPEVTFEASCYTDPLALEHLTGSLSTAITWFGRQQHARLRWVTKYDAVEPLLELEHNGNTRCRISLNSELIARRLEGGTADLPARLAALRKLALPRSAGGGGYKVGAVLAPLMPVGDWRADYSDMFDQLGAALDFDCDLTFELITHRFTPGSKEVLLDWYPNTKLDLDEEGRAEKRNKFGGRKYVYTPETMGELKDWFVDQLALRFPQAQVLYFT